MIPLIALFDPLLHFELAESGPPNSVRKRSDDAQSRERRLTGAPCGRKKRRQLVEIIGKSKQDLGWTAHAIGIGASSRTSLYSGFAKRPRRTTSSFVTR